MRTIFLLLLSLAFGVVANAQPPAVCMTYDAAGNRITRITCGTGLADPGTGAIMKEKPAERDDSALPLTGQIIPNPNDGRFDIALSQSVKNACFEMYSAQGDLVLQQTAQGERNSFHLRDLPSGNYYMVLKSAGRVLGQWIVLKN